MDPTCIICVDCYEKSNHEGHRVRLQRGAAGCCDCGDTTAWRANGFCTDHQGYKEYTEEEAKQLLSEDIANRAKLLFTALGEYLHSNLLNLEKATKSNEAEDKEKYSNKIFFCLACISNC